MFISFEGMEGSGKSTAMNSVAAWLRGMGRTVVCTREPGGSPLGATLRSILLDARNDDICPEAELFLYLADRAQHVARLIRPALERGAIVLSDRYADSTIVYQGYGRGFDPQMLFSLNTMAVGGLWPRCTLVFDIDPRTGLARAQARNEQEGKSLSEGRFEAEALEFHRKIREGFLSWAAAHADRCRVIDGSASPEAVFATSRQVLEELLESSSRC